MLEYGYSKYTMYVGEHLGNPVQEKVTTLTLEEAARSEFSMPNCVILDGKAIEHTKPFGIADCEFSLLDGREKMITKMPIRLMSLSMMQLRERKTMWDVGFCTGSVSIEAKLQFPHLKITAFEVLEEGRELMEINSRKFGVPGMDAVIGDFLQLDLSDYPKPDAVFIGGHGGKLPEMMEKIYSELTEGGVIVMNTVVQSSYDAFMESAKKLNMTLEEPFRIALEDFNPITILKATK